MTIFELASGVAINTNYIIIVGKICYNNTSEKYYMTVVLSGAEANLNIDFETEEFAISERNRLIKEMRGE